MLEDEEVSRLHCSLIADSNEVFLVDEGSSNGTFLNGEAVTRAQAQVGDVIRIGNTQLEFNSVLQISLDQENYSPLSASPTRFRKQSVQQDDTQKHKRDLDSINLGFEPDQDTQISQFTKHRINNILQSLNGGAHLVKAGLESNDLELCKKGWAITDANRGRVTELVLDLLTLLSDTALEPQNCDAAEIVIEAATSLKPKLESAGLTCQFPSAGETFASVDRRSIQTCLQCLIRLVIDAAQGEGASLEFAVAQDQESIQFTIGYPGPPIRLSSEEATDAEADYCGIAALLIRKIVGALSGTLKIRATSLSAEKKPLESTADPAGWSEVIISFPVNSD